MINIVYATTNPGKFAEVSKLFAPHRIILHSPQEYGIQITPPLKPKLIATSSPTTVLFSETTLG